MFLIMHACMCGRGRERGEIYCSAYMNSYKNKLQFLEKFTSVFNEIFKFLIVLSRHLKCIFYTLSNDTLFARTWILKKKHFWDNFLFYPTKRESFLSLLIMPVCYLSECFIFEN